MISYYQLTQYLRLYAIPIVITCGLILNFISFLVMKQIKSSTSRYMTFLALVDSGVLIVGAISLWLHSVSYNSSPIISSIGCKLVPFCFYSLADYSVLIIIIMTYERFYAVWQPVQANQSDKIKHFKFKTIISLLFCLFINSHYIYSHSFFDNNSNNRNFNSSQFLIAADFIPNYVCEYVVWKEFYEKYWIYIDASIYSFVPFILLTTFNVLTILILKKAESKKSKLVHLNSFILPKKTKINRKKLNKKTNNNTTSITKFSVPKIQLDSKTLNSNEICIDHNLNKRSNRMKKKFNSNNSYISNNNNNNCSSTIEYLSPDVCQISEIDGIRMNISNKRLKKRRKSSKLLSHRLFLMLITINISFCVLSMPMTILQIFYYWYIRHQGVDASNSSVIGQRLENNNNNHNNNNNNNSTFVIEHINELNSLGETNDLVDLLHALAELLQFINHGSNFIFYSLSGRTFRNETKQFFIKKFKLFTKALKKN